MEKQHIQAPEERQLPEFNAMQKVKRRFFAMRNGDLAQQMAERGAQYRINFGLNLPQISEIARDFLPGGAEAAQLPAGFSMADFARRLRANDTTRESMLIAPMLFPVDELTMEEAYIWAATAPTPEVADILCLKLLRNSPLAPSLASRLLASPEASERYCGLRLVLNLLQMGKIPARANAPAELDLPRVEALARAEQQRPSPLTASITRQLLSDLAFLAE
jgi:hypothetical protein